MPMRPRKRCPFCHCLYRPDPRTLKRQWACTKAGCQALRRKESQRRWRAKNRSENAARRLREAVAKAKAGVPPADVLPRRGSLVSFPWDEMKDEIEPQVLVMLSFFARLLLSATRDEIRSQLAGITEEFGRLPGALPKDGTAREGPAP
jgi:hypothetical protein